MFSRDAVRAWATQELAARLLRDAARTLGPRADLVPLKGALLGRTLYEHPSERPMTDCDLALLKPSIPVAVARLVRGGFRVASLSSELLVVLDCPRVPGLSLDLHWRPLPLGFGAVSTRWLCQGARVDHALFGTRVLVPDPRRLLVHLLGSVTRDLVDAAAPHVAKDIARLLERSPHRTADHATVIREARLVTAAWVALDWVATQVPTGPVRALRDALAPSRLARYRASTLRRWLAALARPRPPLASFALSRCFADGALDAVAGLGALGVGLPLGALSARLTRS